MKTSLPSLLLLLTLAPDPATVRAAEALPPPRVQIPSSALETIPDWQARLELARVLAYDQQYAAALAEYRRVLQVQPDRGELQAEYGQVLGWAGETEAAIAALSASPRASLPPPAAVLLADLLLGREQFEDATNLYRQALTTVPEDRLTRFKLARVLSWQKLFEDALAEYRLLLATAPDDVQLRRHYARTLGWANQTGAAITEWRRTLPATP